MTERDRTMRTTPGKSPWWRRGKRKNRGQQPEDEERQGYSNRSMKTPNSKTRHGTRQRRPGNR